MKCEHIAVVFISQLLALAGITSGKPCYRAEFSENVWGCPDFDNKMLKCDTLHLGSVEGQEDQVGLNGIIEVLKEIDEGIKVIVEIWKILDIAKEFMYQFRGNLCGSLKDKQTMWYPLIESMKITECPIPANNYSIKDMTISLEHSKSVLTHEFCGSYELQMYTTGNTSDMLSCFQIGVDVIDYEC